jgi:hypothetical protein
MGLRCLDAAFVLLGRSSLPGRLPGWSVVGHVSGDSVQVGSVAVHHKSSALYSVGQPTNAIFVPSGDQAGEEQNERLDAAVRRRSPFPSRSTTQMSIARALSQVKTIRLPAGDHDAW